MSEFALWRAWDTGGLCTCLLNELRMSFIQTPNTEPRGKAVRCVLCPSWDRTSIRAESIDPAVSYGCEIDLPGEVLPSAWISKDPRTSQAGAGAREGLP